MITIDFEELVDQGLKAHPNPDEDLILMDIELNEFESIRILDSIGRDITRKVRFAWKNGLGAVDFKELSSGNYFLKAGNMYTGIVKK